LGGGDARGVTAEVIRALECVDVDGLEVTVVVGAGNPRFREIESAARHAAFAVRLLRDATSMPELMAAADIAVSAGGITSWELAFMGLPAAVCVLAENQRGTAAALGARGIALDLGWHTEMSISEMAGKLSGLARDRSMRLTMSQRGRQLVDGMGADRVVQVLLVESHRDPVRN
jgi:spore coat polysaccharide biosynthesis predicted glycosyltransferase SpsG